MSTVQEEARALGDPTRHAIFGYLVRADGPVGVAELTDHFALNHNAIRQHLAKLVAAGLVVEGRAAPAGPGRPRLVYAVDPKAESRWGAVGPYERLSLLLSQMVRSGESPREFGRGEGQREAADGLAEAGPTETLENVMARHGFDPVVRRRGGRVELVLQACPFASTALAAPDVICELHHGLALGVADGVGGIVVDDLVVKDPRRAHCRLRVHLTDEGPSSPS